MDIPRLATERLILRALAPDDRFAILENYSDPDVTEWFFDQPYTHIEQADQIIGEFISKTVEGTGFAWAILLKENGEFAGTCSYENFEVGRQGEIGFDLAEIEAYTFSHNARARRVLEKLGFRVHSAGEDSHRYTLSRTAWGVNAQQDEI
ncbi:MAG: GNAT family N-acetyltransferase [Anaerolineales bacterium]|nr:GNAT family N-acetyltransferase [Anaerolineales bacterium]